MAESNFYFRDDMEAEKDRKLANGPVTLAPPVNSMAAPVAPAQPAQNPFGDLAKASQAVKPQEQKQDYFADFRTSLAEQDPFKQQAQKAVTDTLANPTAAFDAGANAQQDKLGREIASEGERRRQQSVLQFGGNQTGQVGRAMDNFGNEAIMRQAEFGRDVSAGRAQAGEAARGNAVNQSLALLGESRSGAAQAAGLGLQQESQRDQTALSRQAQGLDERKFQAADANAKAGLSLEASAQALQKAGMSAEDARYYAGLASQEKVAFADLSIKEKSLAQEAGQFRSELEFKKYATDKGFAESEIQRAWQAVQGDKEIASREKLGFAQLSQEDKALAQQAMLAGNQLEWEKQATRLGLDDAQAARIWQSVEGEKQRASQEKLAFAQIGSQEKLQATQQAYEGAQNELNRSLEKLLSNDKIAAQFQLADMDQKFQEVMQTKGFVQEKDLQTMRADLEKSLQARGIDAATATLVADQKFTEMMAGKDQAFQTQMNSVKQQFISGERIDTQDWEKAMRAGEMQQEEIMAKLTSTLRLDEANYAQNFQVRFQDMQNEFSSLMQNEGFTHEKAMQGAAQTFQQKMEQAGYTHEEAMQASQLAAQASENQMNRASQEMMATAQLAQSDSQFMDELAQRYQFNNQDLEIRRQELTANLNLMGLQGDQLKAAISNDKVKSAMDIVALGMEIGNGSPESMAPFVEQFGNALSGYMKEQGIDISKSEFVKAMTPTTANSTGPVVTTRTGAFAPGTKVMGIDVNKITKEDWKALSADPNKLSEFVKQGVVKEIDTIGSITRLGGAMKAFEDAGLSGRIAKSEGTTITFKPQTYIYYNGTPYQLTGYVTEIQGGGTFSDKSRNGLLKGFDLATGKEVVIKRDREDI